MCNKNHFNKVLILTAALLSSVVSAADWNFNDPSKLASGEVSVPGVTLLTAGKSLSTSNVAIAAGSYIGQIISFVTDKATFISSNGLDENSFAFLSSAVNGKIDITGSALAAATGSNTLSTSMAMQTLRRVVIDPNYPYASAASGTILTDIDVQDGEECRLHNSGIIKYYAATSSSYKHNGFAIINGVSVVNKKCALSYKLMYSEYTDGSNSSSTYESNRHMAAAALTNPPVVDVVSASVGGGDIAIRIN